MPMTKGSEVERILDTRVARHTKGKEYLEFLAKWKDYSMEDSTWMSVTVLQKVDCSIEDLMSRNS